MCLNEGTQPIFGKQSSLTDTEFCIFLQLIQPFEQFFAAMGYFVQQESDSKLQAWSQYFTVSQAKLLLFLELKSNVRYASN